MNEESRKMSEADLISLMNVSLTEINYRDESFWNHVYKYFLSTLVIICFPYISEMFNAHELASKIPHEAFCILGIVMAVCFFIVSEAYIARASKAGDVYRQLIEKLPDGYRSQTIGSESKGLWAKVLNWPMKHVVCIMMLIVELSLAVIFWYFL